MIKLPVKMVLMSHLSDIQCSAEFTTNTKVNINRANFCKFLLMKYSDITVEIDAEDEYERFIVENNKKV